MDIYRFIDSKDIREHLQKMKYTFTVPERAFLIYQCRTATLSEKFEAWKEILGTMPDCPMERCIPEISSFHHFLTDYMKIQQKMIDLFYKSENAVYTYETYEKSYFVDLFRDREYDWCESEIFFSEFQKAFLHFKKNYEKGDCEKVRFKKHILASSEEKMNKQQVLEMDDDFNILSVADRGVLDDSEIDIVAAFEEMWFQFPTPFRRGDILVNRGKNGDPFVLDYILTWNTEEFLDNGFSENDLPVKRSEKLLKRLKERGDTTDMAYYGYWIQKNIADHFCIAYDNGMTYLDLERFENPLEGEEKALKAISSMLSLEENKKISIELLNDACQLLFMEEECRRQRECVERIYTEEGRRLTGIS